jgi:hypothetical protein
MNKKELMPFYAGTWLVAAATLMTEIALVRLFSVTMWYHFSFMVISIALFGFGASGALLTFSEKIFKKDIRRSASIISIFFSFTTIAALLIIGRYSLDPFRIADDPGAILRLSASYIVLALPFLTSGLCTGFLLSTMPAHAGSIYCSNLFGSGVGCLAVIFAIPLLAPSGTIVLAAIMGMAAAFCFIGVRNKRFAVFILLLIVLESLFLAKVNTLISFTLSPSKTLTRDMAHTKQKPDFSVWNAISRLDVMGAKDRYYAPGLMSGAKPETFPDQAFIYIDADAIAPITNFSQAKQRADFFNRIPASVAYRLKSRPSVCIIGAGGGFDVLTSLLTAEPRHITAVEINPDIVKLVRKNYGAYSGNLYDLPNVTLRVTEGRTFIRNNPQTFDIIQLSLVDTWAAILSGAYSLTENYLYTEEAFSDYISHLSPGGILTVTRWFTLPPNEALRLLALAVSALENTGVSHPEQNIVFLRSGPAAVLLVKKHAFEKDELQKIQSICSTSGFSILYAPNIQDDNIFHRFLRTGNKRAFYSQYPFNIEPSTDDRPFFFHYYGFRTLAFSGAWKLTIDRNNISYMILLFLLIQALVLSVVFIIGPLFALKKDRSTSKAQKPNATWPAFLYFSAIGLGFMFTEVTLIQKFILFLGNPIYSLAVILASMLIFAGVGSLFSERLIKWEKRNVTLWFLAALALLLLVNAYFLHDAFDIFLGWGFASRLTISIVLIAPLGFLMGVPFPIGIHFTGQRDVSLLPWVWGVNGCFSVLASILGVMIAMTFGFTAVLQCAAACYLIALMALRHIGLPASQGSS